MIVMPPCPFGAALGAAKTTVWPEEAAHAVLFPVALIDSVQGLFHPRLGPNALLQRPHAIARPALQSTCNLQCIPPVTLTLDDGAGRPGNEAARKEPSWLPPSASCRALGDMQAWAPWNSTKRNNPLSLLQHGTKSAAVQLEERVSVFFRNGSPNHACGVWPEKTRRCRQLWQNIAQAQGHRFLVDIAVVKRSRQRRARRFARGICRPPSP